MIRANGITTTSATNGVNLLPEKNPSAGCSLTSEYLLYTHAVSNPAAIPPNTPMFVTQTDEVTCPSTVTVKYSRSEVPDALLTIAPL